MIKNVFFGVLAASALAALPAAAGEMDDNVDLCAAAAVAEGHAAAGEFRAKFVSIKGASVKRLTIELIPYSGDAATEVICKIKRGEVIEVSGPTA